MRTYIFRANIYNLFNHCYFFFSATTVCVCVGGGGGGGGGEGGVGGGGAVAGLEGWGLKVFLFFTEQHINQSSNNGQQKCTGN